MKTWQWIALILVILVVGHWYRTKQAARVAGKGNSTGTTGEKPKPLVNYVYY